MYYLSLNDVVLSSVFKNLEIKLGDEFSITADTNNYVVTINITPTTKISDVDYIILKSNSQLTEDALVSQFIGKYVLHSIIEINGLKLAQSENSLGCSLAQYIFENNLIEGNYLKDLTSEISKEDDLISIIVDKDITIENYISLINNSNLLYVLSYENIEIKPFNAIQTRIGNKFKIKFVSRPVIQSNDVLIEGADYIASLIERLQEEYPKIQFLNNEQDIDDSNFSEWVFYKSYPESFSAEPLVTIQLVDSIYEKVIRSTAQIEFEYLTNDLRCRNTRKIDYILQNFMSNITSCIFTMPGTSTEENPNGRRFSFCVYWDRAAASRSEEINTSPTLANKLNRFSYSFSMEAKLHITIYRSARTYPKVLRKYIDRNEVVPLNVDELDYHKEINRR